MTRIIENQLVIQIYIENLSRIFWQKINNEITLGLIYSKKLDIVSA